MRGALKYAVPATLATALAVAAALYPSASKFCKRAVECGSVASYEGCMKCATPELEKVSKSLLDAHGGVDKSMPEIACVTILWTAANYQITTCSGAK